MMHVAASIYRHHGGLLTRPVRDAREVPDKSPPIVVSVADWRRCRPWRETGALLEMMTVMEGGQPVHKARRFARPSFRLYRAVAMSEMPVSHEYALAKIAMSEQLDLNQRPPEPHFPGP